MDASEASALVLASLSAFAAVWVLLSPSRGRTRWPELSYRPAWLVRPGFVVRAEHRRLSVERSGACARQMPELLDILTLGLAAGLSFDVALSMYCGEYETELADSLGEAMLSWQIGTTSRAEALRGLAEELAVPALGRFSTAVSEAIAFGSPLVAVLERQAETMRIEQRSDVEERIEKVPVKMLIPLGTLIVPAMMLAILGPILASTTGLM